MTKSLASNLLKVLFIYFKLNVFMVIICDANKFNIFLQDCGVALLVANKYCFQRDYLQYSTQHRS